MMTSSETLIKILEDKATRLRIDSIRATTAAGSGHPTSCASAADIVSALFFSVMRYDTNQPHSSENFRRSQKWILGWLRSMVT